MGNLENVKLICLGFEISAEAKENIRIVFQNLLDEVPYNAFMKVTLSKVETGISGEIQISSIIGEFSSSKVEMTPQAVVQNLYADLHLQLMEWKSRRFVDIPAHAMAK